MLGILGLMVHEEILGLMVHEEIVPLGYDPDLPLIGHLS